MSTTLELNNNEIDVIQSLNLGALNTLKAEQKEIDKEKYQKMLTKYATEYDIYCQDFSKKKFRPHAIHNLMGGLPKPLTDRQTETLAAYQRKISEGKGLTDRQYIDYGSLLSKKNAKPILSTGAITYLNQMHKELVFNRTNELKNKYLNKGLAVEHLSIEMVNEVFGVELTKNSKRFENDYLTGEPDIIHGKKVYDIKSSWDFKTFPLQDKEIKNQAYYYQLQGYMDLLGLDEAKLIYVLVDTPEPLIEDEIYRVARAIGSFDSSLSFDIPEELELEIRRNLVYTDIPKEKRIKIFDVKRDDAVIDQIHQMVELARDYLQTIEAERITDVLHKF